MPLNNISYRLAIALKIGGVAPKSIVLRTIKKRIKMKQQTYIKEMPQYETAFDFMVMKNKACEKAGNKNDSFCVVPGPEDNYAVVDLMTGIELGLGYVWAYGGFISNPFINN